MSFVCIPSVPNDIYLGSSLQLLKFKCLIMSLPSIFLKLALFTFLCAPSLNGSACSVSLQFRYFVMEQAYPKSCSDSMEKFRLVSFLNKNLNWYLLFKKHICPSS